MKISEILSENNQRIDLKLSNIFDKLESLRMFNNYLEMYCNEQQSFKIYDQKH